MGALRVLIAAGHPPLRDVLRHAVQATAPLAEYCDASDPAELLARLSDQPAFDLALVELLTLGAQGCAFIRRVCAMMPGAPVVVFSSFSDSVHIQQTIGAGAVGYVPKNTSPDVLVGALRLVLSGGIYVPPSYYRRHLVNVDEVSHSAFVATPGLTERQHEILLLLQQGKANKSIARDLGISEHTVKVHISAIFRTLGVANRTQAVLVTRAV